MKMSEDDLKGFPIRRKVKICIGEIQWETDGAEVDLPHQLSVTIEPEIEDTDDDILESVSNQLSDTYGFLHNGFRVIRRDYVED